MRVDNGELGYASIPGVTARIHPRRHRPNRDHALFLACQALEPEVSHASPLLRGLPGGVADAGRHPIWIRSGPSSWPSG